MGQNNQEFTTLFGNSDDLDKVEYLFSKCEKEGIECDWKHKTQKILFYDFHFKRENDNALSSNCSMRNSTLEDLWKKLTKEQRILVETTVSLDSGLDNIWDLTIFKGKVVKQVCIKDVSKIKDPYNYTCHSTFTGRKFGAHTSDHDENNMKIVNSYVK